MPVELHCHSTASDGTLSPAALVAAAAAAGIDTLALTDHDTVGGIAEAIEAGAGLGVRVVAGIELSVRVARGTFHLLGYLPEPCPAPLAARLDEIASGRDARNRAIVDRLGELGVPIAWADVAARAAGRVGRPHIADALVAAGHAADRVEAFDRWIGEQAPAYLSAGVLEPAEAIALVRACGGLATLAHPATLRLDPDALEVLVARLAAAGLDGLEAHRCDSPPAEQAVFAALAARHGLVATGGSDYHGPDSERWGKRLGATGDPGADPAVLEAFLPEARVLIDAVVTEADVAASVAVVNETDPRADADLADALHARREPGRLALLARADDGAIVGAGATGPIGGDTAWYVSVNVRETARRQGVGTELLDRLAEHAHAHGAGGLELESRSPAGLAFAAARGFVETGREAEVVLDLRTTSLEVPPPPAGIEIVRRSERPGLEAAMYAVALEAEPDIPGRDDGRGPGSLAEFRALNLDRPARRPELTFIALADDVVVGYAILHAGARHIAYHGMTGVARAWRGRGIASALKRRQIAAARAAGYDLLVTENEVRNDPIRRLNEAFGYEPYGETVFLHKELP